MTVRDWLTRHPGRAGRDERKADAYRQLDRVVDESKTMTLLLERVVEALQDKTGDGGK